MKKLEESRGITLIALIITIIVMLILVGVTVNVALNGGLFNAAEDAAKKTQVEIDKEILQSAVIAALNEELKIPNADSLKNNLPERWDATGSDGGPYTATSPSGNEFTVDGNGKITSNSGEEEPPTGDLELLEKYVLGQDKTGRPITDIVNMDTMTFIDDATTDGVDETQTLVVETLTTLTLENEDCTKVYIYVKHDNREYKITCDTTTFESEKLELIYTPQGREGEKVSYDSDNDGKAEEWMIIYDNGDNIEMVSMRNMGELTLGYDDKEAQTPGDIDENKTVDEIDKAIYSYNNAITRLNYYCESLVTKEDKNRILVRSVGSDPSNPNNLNNPSDPASGSKIPYYESENLANWNSGYNGIGKSGDTNFEQDFVRMIYHNCNATGEYYYVASRGVSENSERAYFYMYQIASIGDVVESSAMWTVSSSDVTYNPLTSRVRPVIKMKAGSI